MVGVHMVRVQKVQVHKVGLTDKPLKKYNYISLGSYGKITTAGTRGMTGQADLSKPKSIDHDS